MDNNPREFDIWKAKPNNIYDKNGEMYAVEVNAGHYNGETFEKVFHVIEKAAYDRLQKYADELALKYCELRDSKNKEIEELKSKIVYLECRLNEVIDEFI